MVRRSLLPLLVAVSWGCNGAPAPGTGGDGSTPTADATPPADARVVGRPRVILMIGDGMGPGQLDAASLYAHGATGQLFMHSLPVNSEVDTASLSGTTDSGASATTMATGVRTLNYRIGVDEHGNPVETLVERAHLNGQAAGVVSTASLPHATPGAFTAHRSSRAEYLNIADDQALLVRPEVLLGGGALYYLPVGPGSQRSDGGLLAPLQAGGWQVVRTAGELALADPSGGRIVGVFAADHMTYSLDRAADTTEPTLTEMSLTALEFLDQDPDGFFLMIEGARIDMASHGNDLENAVGETLAFDAAIQAVAGWAATHDNTTLIVTADHETGGLEVVSPAPAGTLPVVSWRWGSHTNTSIKLFGLGPGAAAFDGVRGDHVRVHAALLAALENRPFVEPPPTLAPSGDLADLRHIAALQVDATGFGAGYNQLDSLWLDADARVLAIGVEGVFQWNKNAVVVLVDTDFGAGTGPATLAGALTDHNGRIDAILASLSLDAPPVPGFGADFALVAWGGQDPRIEDLSANAGVRGLRSPFGEPGDLGWYAAATNFASETVVKTLPATPSPGRGWEIHVPWAVLYPFLAGSVPPGATMAIAVVLVNDDGGFTSNQALPPFAPGVDNPGRVITPLPGVIVFQVDSDTDGVADGDAAPTALP